MSLSLHLSNVHSCGGASSQRAFLITSLLNSVWFRLRHVATLVNFMRTKIANADTVIRTTTSPGDFSDTMQMLTPNYSGQTIQPSRRHETPSTSFHRPRVCQSKLRRMYPRRGYHLISLSLPHSPTQPSFHLTSHYWDTPHYPRQQTPPSPPSC